MVKRIKKMGRSAVKRIKKWGRSVVKRIKKKMGKGV